MSITAADNFDRVLVDTDFFLATDNNKITSDHNTNNTLKLGI